MNKSKSLTNVIVLKKKSKSSKSLQNFSLANESKNKEKKDNPQILDNIEAEIDVSEIKLDN